jgi:hypothetical protein
VFILKHKELNSNGTAMPFVKGQSGSVKHQFKPGKSGNPGGLSKGYKHISTHVQRLLHDEKFTKELEEKGIVTEYKGIPIEALIKVQIVKALQGDTKAFEALKSAGWGNKIELEADVEQRLIIETRRAGTTNNTNVIEGEVITPAIADNSNSDNG